MTAEVVNLRRVRKAKARAGHAADGAANRAKFGLTRGARDGEVLRRDVLERRLDGHRLDDGEAWTEDGGRD